jgi:hypothetical protein
MKIRLLLPPIGRQGNTKQPGRNRLASLCAASRDGPYFPFDIEAFFQ